MSAHRLACPRCRAAVPSASCAAAGDKLRCAACGSHFTSPGPVPAADDTVADVPSLSFPAPEQRFPKEALIALAAAALLGSAILAAALLVSRDRPAPVVVHPDGGEQARLDEQRRQIFDEQRRQLDEERRRLEQDRRLDEERQAVTKVEVAKKSPMVDAIPEVAPLDPAPPAPRPPAADPNTKVMAEYQAHMNAGNAALKAKRFEEAVAAFQAAQKLMPGEEVADALKEAEKRLIDHQDRERKQLQYAGFMERGVNGLKARRFDAAIEAFEAAQRVFPEDREAQRAVRDAKQAKKDARAAFAKALAKGNAALQAQQLQEAAQAYAEASQLMPEDPAAAQAKERADKLTADAKALTPARPGANGYLLAMTQGNLALRAGRFAEASRAFAEALRLAPNDIDALAGYREAQAGLKVVIVARADYDRQMQAGALAFQQRRYGDAIKAYVEALRLAPDDAAAAAGLSQARYAHGMAQGRLAFAARRYADAVRFYQEALREKPGDFAAQTGLRQAQALAR